MVLSPTGGLTKTVFNPSALKVNSSITSQIASQRATVAHKKKLLQVSTNRLENKRLLILV